MSKTEHQVQAEYWLDQAQIDTTEQILAAAQVAATLALVDELRRSATPREATREPLPVQPASGFLPSACPWPDCMDGRLSYEHEHEPPALPDGVRVYEWQSFLGSEQTYAVVAARSQAAAARAAGVKRPTQLWNLTVSANADEIRQALTDPGTVFHRPINARGPGQWRTERKEQ